MLYITTRDKTDAFTAKRTVSSHRGPDGGMYVPFRMPSFTHEEILAMKDRSFNQNVADVLNLFFGCSLTAWDLEFAGGKQPAKLVANNFRVVFAENWHNQYNDLSWMIQQLFDRVSGEKGNEPTQWFAIAVRIACLFANFAELLRDGSVDFDHPADVAVATCDFSAPMAVWYGKAMGLPVATIICSCNENSGVWDLIHQGQIHTDALAIQTALPDANHAVPAHLERLIFGVFGYEENQRYLDCCRRGKIYSLDDEMAETLRDGIFSAVVSKKRMEGVIHSAMRSGSYLMDPYTAIAFGGLQDYRAKTGGSRMALILSDRSPLEMASVVSQALGVSQEELHRLADKGEARGYGSLRDR